MLILITIFSIYKNHLSAFLYLINNFNYTENGKFKSIHSGRITKYLYHNQISYTTENDQAYTAGWGEDDNQDDPGSDPDPREHGRTDRPGGSESSETDLEER